MTKNKEDRVEISIPEIAPEEKPKKTEKTKKVAKVEKVAKVNKIAKVEKKTLKIDADDLHIQIPNSLEYVSRAKKILQVYEDELRKSEPRPEPEMDEEIDEERLLDLPEITPKGEVDLSKPEVPQEQVIEEQKQVEVKPEGEIYDVCPLCKGKLKKKKIKISGGELKQRVICKNRKCNFEREYVFSI